MAESAPAAVPHYDAQHGDRDITNEWLDWLTATLCVYDQLAQLGSCHYIGIMEDVLRDYLKYMYTSETV